MATEQIAWAIDGLNNLSILFPDSQGASYLNSDLNIQDLTISPEGVLTLLTWEGQATVLHSAKQEFPLNWNLALLELEGGLQGVKIDAGPNGLYVVLNDGSLISTSVPKGEAQISYEVVPGIENVSQVSAAADGIIWVVAFDINEGTIVKWYEKNEWNTVPNLKDAKKVTGTPKGHAFIINSDGELARYSKKGQKTSVQTDFKVSQVSMGPNGRLWVRSEESDFISGNRAYWSDDEGKTWHEVKNSGVNQLDAGVIEMNFA